MAVQNGIFRYLFQKISAIDPRHEEADALTRKLSKLLFPRDRYEEGPSSVPVRWHVDLFQITFD